MDQVQGAAKYAAYRTLTHAERLRRRNASHRETYFEDMQPPEETALWETVSRSKAGKRDRGKTPRREIRSTLVRRKTPEKKTSSVREQGRRLAQRKAARQSINRAETRTYTAVRKKLSPGPSARKTGSSMPLSGAGLAAVILPLSLILAFAVLLYSGGGAKTPVSEEVNAYTLMQDSTASPNMWSWSRR